MHWIEGGRGFRTESGTESKTESRTKSETESGAESANGSKFSQGARFADSLPGRSRTSLSSFLFTGVVLFFALNAGIGQESPSKSPPAPAPAAPAKPATPAPARPAAPRPPRFLVFIDPAHGGSETGARLSNQLLEKDLDLSLSVRLRSALNAHGIPVVTSRESDVYLSAVSRTQAANHVNASACIALHATASGNGVHLFTSSLAPIPMSRFLPWDSAQGAYATQSQKLSSEIDSAMTYSNIPVILGRTALQTLDSLTCPAVAIEIAPLSDGKNTIPVSDAEYQNRVLAALTTALEQWQKDWRQP